LQENASQYHVEFAKPDPAVKLSDENDKFFARYWIYSHHIYSKIKRREILDLANEFSITGFCLPGRPGIICAEGLAGDCNEWWQKVCIYTLTCLYVVWLFIFLCYCINCQG
jgi:hypothetical protein